MVRFAARDRRLGMQVPSESKAAARPQGVFLREFGGYSE